MKLHFLITGILYFTCTVAAYAGHVISDVPADPDLSVKYIFYLHGVKEEQKGSTKKYEGAVEAIAKGSATVISEVRGDTDPNTYALRLKEQVGRLLEKGVPAKNITLSGYSKGSIIALAAAGAIQIAELNYVLLAGCSEALNLKYHVDSKKVIGRLLSIYDSRDTTFGSCEGIIVNSDQVQFEEIELDSGKGHKLFGLIKEKFIEQWRDLLLDWAGA